jgi:SAM-dependent methyltransferase
MPQIFSRISRSAAFRGRALKKKLGRKWTRFKARPIKAPDSKHQRFAMELNDIALGLRGKRIFEIGSDSSAEFLGAVLASGASFAAGVNPAIEREIHRSDLALVNGDARETTFPSSSFDIVASMSVFEHVHGLNEVLNEAYRLLVPGGLLVAEFAPIWSAAWGHHLWLYHDGEVVDWNSHPLPPYAHLLMSESELSEWAHNRYGDMELAQKIARFVFHSDEQNRLFFSDYVRLFAASRFEVVCISGFGDIPHPHQMPRCDYPKTFRRLRIRYPEKDGFGYHGMRVVLHKS